MNKFKAFIFDMDGVIIDSEPIHIQVIQQTMKQYGISVSKELLESYTGRTSSDIFATLIQMYNLPGTPMKMTKEHMNKIKQYVTEHNIQPIRGIPELLNNLHEKNIPAAIASSSPLDVIEFVAAHFGITHFYKFYTSGESIEHGKPAPDIYLQTAQRLGIDPAQCIVLEDSKNGSIAAKAAGMYCIGFANPNSGNQDLSAADEIIRSITDIDLKKYF